MRILSVPSVTRTHLRESPSCGFMTISPLARILTISFISILFTTPRAEIRKRCFPVVPVRSIIAETLSSFARARDWTIGCHFAVRCISGIS